MACLEQQRYGAFNVLSEPDFVDSLSALWGSHLAPKPNESPTCISLFAGCGGSTLGYSAAGFRELLAVEFNAQAVETLRKNFQDVPVFTKDIHGLSGKEALTMAGVSVGELDLLDGSPPCQSFSTSGKRRLDDIRGFLYLEYVRMLRVFMPKFLVLENVPGMITGQRKPVFQDMIKKLEATGYTVQYKILNASFFGVAQSRHRLFVIGSRTDIEHPGFPLEQYRQFACSDAWAGVTNEAHDLERAFREISTRAGSVGKVIKNVPEGRFFKDYSENGKYFSWRRLSIDKPSGTVPKSAASLVHPNEHRTITNAEAKRLQGFPDAFQFTGGWAATRAQIGNAVPPPMTMSIGNQIKIFLMGSQGFL